LLNRHPGIFTTNAKGEPETGIAFVGRLQFDVATISRAAAGRRRAYRPRPQQRLPICVAAASGVTGLYGHDWQYDFVGEFGGVNTNEVSASSSPPR